jgi:DnaJ-domain-containing protein 1
MLAWMVKTALADGQLDDRERALLESVAARHRVPPDRLEGMLAAARSGTLDVPAPVDAGDAREHLRAIARVALADGKLAPAENALLRNAGRRLGLSDYDIGQLLRGARRELYADARQHLRAARNGMGNGDGRP